MSNNNIILNSAAITHLLTYIRDKNTNNSDFAMYADRLHRILVEEGIARIPGKEVNITTPTNSECKGWLPDDSLKLCGVSIVRAGDSLLGTLRACQPGISVGKILIQRDHDTALPKLFYSKFPPDIKERYCILCDPMLATGGSANMAISVLNDVGVPDENIMFLNVVGCPEGLEAINKLHPNVKIICAACDSGLNELKYIVPGCGDYGDRFYNTN